MFGLSHGRSWCNLTFLLHGMWINAKFAGPSKVWNGIIIHGMDTPFVYDRYVTGRCFVGRKKECDILANLLDAGEHVAIYEPPKTGKMSLIQQTLMNMRSAGRQFVTTDVNLFNIRTLEDFLVKFGTTVLRACMTTPEQFREAVGRHLAQSHFVFDISRYYRDGTIVSMNWNPDSEDVRLMMQLPQRLAEEKGVPFYIILKEFQMLVSDPVCEDALPVIEDVLREKHSKPSAAFIMTGSQVNSMKYIFEEKRYFYRKVVHLPLQPVEDKELIEHIVKGFLYGPGKSFDRNLAMGACSLFKCHVWYLNHIAAICDSMSKGFINEAIMVEALNSMIALHEPRFINMVNDLTDHQLSLLVAVLDGVTRLSASEVIEKYHLNSSANVRRVKDALKKKEIITFNEKDEPVILDPLFEYWMTKYFLERQ